MDAIEILTDAAERPLHALEQIRARLTPELLNIHLGGHDNSVAWLLWHTGRGVDAQFADLSSDEQVWRAGGFRERLALGEVGDTVGYGHTSEQARSIVTNDAEGLLEYAKATVDALTKYISSLSQADLDDVVDERWTPPVTRGVRLVSIIDDAVQHLAQAAYVLGATQ